MCAKVKRWIRYIYIHIYIYTYDYICMVGAMVGSEIPRVSHHWWSIRCEFHGHPHCVMFDVKFHSLILFDLITWELWSLLVSYVKFYYNDPYWFHYPYESSTMIGEKENISRSASLTAWAPCVGRPRNAETVPNVCECWRYFLAIKAIYFKDEYGNTWGS